MASLQKIRRLLFIIVPFGLVLLALLAGFQAIPAIQGSTAQAVNNAGLQRARSLSIAKNALILEYRTDAKTRSQAISDLQVIVPLFEQEQGTLNSYKPTDIQVLMSSSRSDYLTLDAALKDILANQDKPVEQARVDIIIIHATAYNVIINQVMIVVQNLVDDEAQHLFLIETSIDAILITLAIILFASVLGMTKKDKRR